MASCGIPAIGYLFRSRSECFSLALCMCCFQWFVFCYIVSQLPSVVCGVSKDWSCVHSWLARGGNDVNVHSHSWAFISSSTGSPGDNLASPPQRLFAFVDHTKKSLFLPYLTQSSSCVLLPEHHSSVPRPVLCRGSELWLPILALNHSAHCWCYQGYMGLSLGLWSPRRHIQQPGATIPG